MGGTQLNSNKTKSNVLLETAHSLIGIVEIL